MIEIISRVISRYLSKAIIPQALPLILKLKVLLPFGRKSGTWLFLNEKEKKEKENLLYTGKEQ